MTREELNNKSFEEVMEQLNEERDDIHSYEDMKDFAKYQIESSRKLYRVYV